MHNEKKSELVLGAHAEVRARTRAGGQRLKITTSTVVEKRGREEGACGKSGQMRRLCDRILALHFTSRYPGLADVKEGSERRLSDTV